MRRIRPTVIVGLLLLFSTAAQAGTFFLGVSAGQGNIRNTLEGFTFDGDETGLKAFLGYQFIPNVFIEGSYTDFGSFKESAASSTLRADVKSYGLWGAGRVPIGRLFSFFIKLGLARTEADFELDLPLDQPRSTSDTDTNITWGFGFGLNLGKRFTIRAEFEGYETDSVQNLEFLSLGAQINF